MIQPGLLGQIARKLENQKRTAPEFVWNRTRRSSGLRLVVLSSHMQNKLNQGRKPIALRCVTSVIQCRLKPKNVVGSKTFTEVDAIFLYSGVFYLNKFL